MVPLSSFPPGEKREKVRQYREKNNISALPVVDEKTLPVVLDILTNGTKDIPDAVILASAIVYADMILTEARDIPVLIGEYDTEIECLNLNNFLKR